MKLVLHLQAANTENLTRKPEIIKEIVWYFSELDWLVFAGDQWGGDARS